MIAGIHTLIDVNLNKSFFSTVQSNIENRKLETNLIQKRNEKTITEIKTVNINNEKEEVKCKNILSKR